jgi:uncharacterized protein (DUF1499 family)
MLVGYLIGFGICEEKKQIMQISRTFPARIMSYSYVVLFLLTVSMVGSVLGREQNSGGDGVQIAPCPQSPNCVSSLDQDPDHRVKPLRHDLTDNQALTRLRSIIETMPRTKVVQSTNRYLHVEFRSAIFGFVDDLELLIAENPGVIHIRSSSRIGYWDFGVNRRRVERIREKFIHKSTSE